MTRGAGEIIKPVPSEEEKYAEVSEGLVFRDLEFWVANGTLRLETNIDNQITVLAETLVSVVLDEQKVVKELKTIIAQVGESSYLLKINNDSGKYQAAISAPRESGRYPIVVLMVVYTDGTRDTARGSLLVKNYGKVLGLTQGSGQYASAGLHTEELGGVTVSLWARKNLEQNGLWQFWPGDKYYQNNPQVTNERGEYGYMVSNGSYYMILEKKGYKKSVTPEFEVKNNTINWDLHLEGQFGKKWYEKIEYWLGLGLLLLIIVFWVKRKNKEDEEGRKERTKREVLG